jgi:hypothetical protein
MREARRSAGAGAVLLAWLLLSACGGSEETPEAQVRRTLAEVEAAAEEADLDVFRERVSERYRDALGHDKEALLDTVRFHVLMHPRGRHVVLRVRDLRLVSPERAAVVLHAGFAGRSGGGLHADVYEIELDLEREGDAWRLTAAEWRPAPPASLL